jgi:chromatin segregation and condensation protein Rec8/ScpA/Scc1 (kleisin family)
VPLPFRFEFTTTSVQDLINALERALNDESSRGEVPRLPTLPIPVPNFLDFEQYLLEIEARSDELLEKMRATEDGDELRLSRMVAGLNWLDAVRLFMMLLFLAQRMEIDLDQDEDETDVTIKVRAKNL